jgi:hypothetical protein
MMMMVQLVVMQLVQQKLISIMSRNRETTINGLNYPNFLGLDPTDKLMSA